MLSFFMKFFRFIKTMKSRMFLFASLAVACRGGRDGDRLPLHGERRTWSGRRAMAQERRMNVFRVLLAEKGAEFQLKDGQAAGRGARAERMTTRWSTR